ncbi:uncharacterized protein LOC123309794 isoform X1 [Coccinella septempunctata]|uniref:uncharacterized protein LOC123309794 isoform X1 n=1 Tax=Coccinella septempunctata TaxID=41139 RepID=UPI001D074C5F|nr:uncharacterized protein LOC123309794 isoform X1 [Coccinella septempunctata]
MFAYFDSEYYEDAEKKLKEIEKQLATSSSAVSDNDESLAVGKRIAKRKILEDFYLDQSTDDEEIAIPPKIRKDSERKTKSPRLYGSDPQASGSGVSREISQPRLTLRKGFSSSQKNLNPREMPSIMTSVNEIMDRLNTTEGIMKDILRRLHRIEQNIVHLCETAQNVPETDQNITESRFELEILENLEQLQEFEQKLQDIQFFAKVVNTLGFMGGKSREDVCRSILSNLLSKNFCFHLNWTGRQQKIAFSKFTYINKAILVATRKNKGCEDATQSEVEGTIKAWLRNVYERGARRETTQ